jgi:hypothetical protein
METSQDLWQALRRLPEKEWRRLREKRDRLSGAAPDALSWRVLAGSVPPDDLERMKKAIDSECERIDGDGWK